MISARLAESRPDDALVGEEGARKTGEGRTWYVDPVDGTYNFLSGIPYWCSAVGLVDHEGPLLGAVYYPDVDQLWLGGREIATTLNGERVPSLLSQGLSEISIATYYPPRHLPDRQRLIAWQSVVASAATLRILGSASIDLARRSEQPTRSLPASQSERLGLVSRRSARNRRRRGRRRNRHRR